MKKKILAMLMAVCFVVSCAVMSASAVEDESVSVCASEEGCGQVVQFLTRYRAGTPCAVSGCGGDVSVDLYACKNTSCSQYDVPCGGYKWCNSIYMHTFESWGKYGVWC